MIREEEADIGLGLNKLPYVNIKGNLDLGYPSSDNTIAIQTFADDLV
ncbi:hypothetical protein GCM10009094_18560 [Massilia aurea]